jgi:hypothetical protein
MPIKRKNETDMHVEIMKLDVREITFNIVGQTPLILNRQSEKAKRQLMMPPLPQNKAQRTQTLKHHPYEEFKASPYLSRRDPKSPTWLHLPGGMFKKCIAQAALDIPGASKAQIGRLVSLGSTEIHLWGIPFMRADMVRQAGISKTPDVRFRACVPNWATTVTYSYIPAIISPVSLANLLSAAGVICGIGDYRVEKGAGDFGQFRIVADGDPEWREIVENGGREAQFAAWSMPQPYDDDTRELVEWFDEELERRQRMPDIVLDSSSELDGETELDLPPELDNGETGLELPQ